MAAVADVGCSVRLAPAPAVTMRAAAGTAWRAAGPVARAIVGAVTLVTVGLIGWQLQHPFIGLDGYLYHLALSGAWAETATRVRSSTSSRACRSRTIR